MEKLKNKALKNKINLQNQKKNPIRIRINKILMIMKI